MKKKIFLQPMKKEKLNGITVDTTIDNNKLEKHMEVLSMEKEIKEKVKRATSEPTLVPRESTLTSSGREKHRHRRTKRPHKTRPSSRFGYEIADLDSFLTKVFIYLFRKNNCFKISISFSKTKIFFKYQYQLITGFH